MARRVRFRYYLGVSMNFSNQTDLAVENSAIRTVDLVIQRRKGASYPAKTTKRLGRKAIYRTRTMQTPSERAVSDVLPLCDVVCLCSTPRGVAPLTCGDAGGRSRRQAVAPERVAARPDGATLQDPNHQVDMANSKARTVHSIAYRPLILPPVLSCHTSPACEQRAAGR